MHSEKNHRQPRQNLTAIECAGIYITLSSSKIYLHTHTRTIKYVSGLGMLDLYVNIYDKIFRVLSKRNRNIIFKLRKMTVFYYDMHIFTWQTMWNCTVSNLSIVKMNSEYVHCSDSLNREFKQKIFFLCKTYFLDKQTNCNIVSAIHVNYVKINRH